MSDSTKGKKQIGARVDEQLHNHFKAIVEFEHDAARGPLGAAHEKAMKYYITHFLLQNPDSLEEFATSERIDADPDVVKQTLLRYMDNVGPEMADSACVIEDAAAPSEDTTRLRDRLSGAIHIWHRVREKLFAPAPSIELEKEQLEEIHELALQFGSIEEIEERLAQLEDLSEASSDSQPLKPSN